MKKFFVTLTLLLITAAVLLTGCGYDFDPDNYFGSLFGSTPIPSDGEDGDGGDENAPTAEPLPTVIPAPYDGGEHEAPKFKEGDTTDTFTVSEIYADNVNSVVGIITSATTTNVWGQVSRSSCAGTGIIISEDGYIMTNHHVVEDGTSFKVTLYDGTTYEAALIGGEEANDIAVLKIDAKNLRPVSFGDSDKIIVGEDVMVIGNPLGELTYTLTRGVVSALNRVINTSDTPINMFQVDAAINAGNSGGPAFDAHGNVIGVVSAKYASSSIEGLGFCIPINDALNVASQLIEFGYVKGKAALGIGAAEAYSRSSFWGISQRVSGAYVSHVIKGFAADKAGIVEGMLINYVNTTTVTSSSDLSTALRSYKAGETVTLKGYYNNEYFEKSVTLGEYSPSLVPENWNPNNGTIM